MTISPTSRVYRALRWTLCRRGLLLGVPLLVSACSPGKPVAAGCALLVGAAFLLLMGFATGVSCCYSMFERLETRLTTEHRRQLTRLTEASTEIATEAERAIEAARAALAALRLQLLQFKKKER